MIPYTFFSLLTEPRVEDTHPALTLLSVGHHQLHAKFFPDAFRSTHLLLSTVNMVAQMNIPFSLEMGKSPFTHLPYRISKMLANCSQCDP